LHRNNDQARFRPSPYSELTLNVTGKAIWYIESHLRGDLSLDAIAEVAGVSKFHLSRAFGLSTGMQLSGYVRSRRLTEAAKGLAQGAPDILDVALEAGYGSHEAFTRAFRQQFGLTPDQFRAQASVATIKLMEPMRMEPNAVINLSTPRKVQSGELLIFGLADQYNNCQSNARMPSQWERFVPHIGHIRGQIGNVAYGAIGTSDESGNFTYLCGVQVSDFPSQPPEFTGMRIAPQTYAVFEHNDHISTISTTFQAIWNHGLSDFGYRAVDAPILERYDERFDGRTGRGTVEIWVPVG
jgi:AraC family transcriptional regulator